MNALTNSGKWETSTRAVFAAALLLTLSLAAPAEELHRDPADGMDFFEKKVRPLLVANCYNCHSADNKAAGGLRVDDHRGILQGDNRGPAIIQLHTGTRIASVTRPSMGAWLLYGLGTENQDLPGYITINPSPNFGGVVNYGSAFLPAHFQGTRINDTGDLPNLQPQVVTPLQRRQIDLIQAMNRDLQGVQAQGRRSGRSLHRSQSLVALTKTMREAGDNETASPNDRRGRLRVPGSRWPALLISSSNTPVSC
ncbi:MAG: DUF1501 domain-containing protein [Planctomycetaceae bacterium]